MFNLLVFGAATLALASGHAWTEVSKCTHHCGMCGYQFEHSSQGTRFSPCANRPCKVGPACCRGFHVKEVDGEEFCVEKKHDKDHPKNSAHLEKLLSILKHKHHSDDSDEHEHHHGKHHNKHHDESSEEHQGRHHQKHHGKHRHEKESSEEDKEHHKVKVTVKEHFDSGQLLLLTMAVLF
ncbi:unnamed protein product, partial [Mesorhabditis spiculigera]